MFIRQDLPVAHQLVQSNHAVFHLALALQPECGVPNIIMVGVPDVKALERVRAKLKANQVPHYAWAEPDHDFGFTAIATGPLDAEKKKVLSQYRLYKERGDASNGLGGSCLTPAPDAAVASE